MARSVVAALALLWPTAVQAHEFYTTRVPNPATSMNAAGETTQCITCHDNPDGGAACETTGGARPCLNLFGLAFRTNGFLWDATLSGLDSDADGFTNGQELQDPLGGWLPGDDEPGVDAYATRPGFEGESPGMTDGDNDGFCWFGRDLDGNGDCLGSGENDGSLDCDDALPTVNSGATELCTNVIDDDCNGLATLEDPVCESVVDRDGDGICPVGQDTNGDRDCIDTGEITALVDCDDSEITVFPGNRENCTDGLDNDCNTLVDDFDDMCRSDIDADGDRYCPLGRDLNGDGDCLDPTEAAGGADCDDTNVDVNPGQAEICTDTLDNDCDGEANFEDTECIDLFDADEDGFCPGGVDQNGNGHCADSGEAIAPFDCDDTESSVNPSAMEMCVNTRDDDCDTLISLADDDCAGYLDRDGDRFCFVGFDMNRDGDCADAGEEGGGSDCNDDDAAIVPESGGMITPEICIDEVDNNCDGSVDGFDPMCGEYLDRDGDLWCEAGRDMNADGDCTDADEPAADLTDPTMVDEAPDDSTIHPGAGENCFDMKDNDQDDLVDEGPALFSGDYRSEGSACTRDTDADSDGWCPIGRDLNNDGDCLDENENVAESDCDDSDPERHPRTTELCRNLLDDDCDGNVDLFDTDCFRLLDRDRDGFCGEGIDDNRDGDCLDEAEDRFGTDCNDLDAAINVRAAEICDDEIDNDCDGLVDVRDTTCPCVPAMCDDGDPCTLDMCGADICIHPPNPACADAGTNGDAGITPPTEPEDDGGCAAGAASGQPSNIAIILACLGWIARRRRVR